MTDITSEFWAYQSAELAWEQILADLFTTTCCQNANHRAKRGRRSVIQTKAISTGGGAAGQGPSASRAASERRHNSAPPSDSPAASSTSRGKLPASCCTVCAGAASET